MICDHRSLSAGDITCSQNFCC